MDGSGWVSVFQIWLDTYIKITVCSLTLFSARLTWTMTRFGVPVAVDGCIPDPVREFFLAVTVTTLARVLEVANWDEVVVLVADGSWLDEYDDRLAQDCDFFSFRLCDAELVMAVAWPSGELPFPPSPPSDCSFLDPFLFADTATMRFHGNTLIIEGRLRDFAAAVAASLEFLLFWTAV